MGPGRESQEYPLDGLVSSKDLEKDWSKERKYRVYTIRIVDSFHKTPPQVTLCDRTIAVILRCQFQKQLLNDSPYIVFPNYTWFTVTTLTYSFMSRQFFICLGRVVNR